MTKTIALDAGHGMNTAGKRTPDGVHEWELNDKVRDKIVALLDDYDVAFIFTDGNEGNVDESLSARLNQYLNANVDVFVSIHHNAFTGTWNNATGVEVYTDKNPTSQDVKLANAIYSRLPKYTGLTGRGIKQENFYVINQNRIPAILVEGGFMDSTNDYGIITSAKGQEAYARAVVDGLIEYLGLVKVNKPSQPVNGLEPYSGYVEVTYSGADGIDCHSKPTFDGYVSAVVYKGTVLTVVGRILVDGVYMYLTKAGHYITSAKEYVVFRTSLHGNGSTSNPAPALTPIQVEANRWGMKVASNLPKGTHFWISEHATVYGGSAYGTPIPSSIKKATTIYTSGGQRTDHGSTWVLANEIMSWVKVSECLVK